MRSASLVVSFFFAPLALADERSDFAVDTASLLREMADLERLARAPSPSYRTIQWSSFDRRSRGPEEAGWFSNSDGFGGEPIPGFEAVLRAPGTDGDPTGEFLIGEANGPGAIVRTWSAGMAGRLRVFLDGAAEPMFDGRADEFLRRRAERVLAAAGVAGDLGDLGDAFSQEDADYFPIPFAKSLRITWQGRLDELHFYHVNVRLFSPGVAVKTFASDDAKAASDVVREVAATLRDPERLAPAGTKSSHEIACAPDHSEAITIERENGAAITHLRARVEAADLVAALRGTLLRIAFDGSQRPQVECPIGDFFGTTPGIQPYSTLPMSVDADGTMICRFVMPFARSAVVTVVNTTTASVKVSLDMWVNERPVGQDALRFRARWRVDHDLDTRAPQDLPYLLVQGKGRLVGVAAHLMNPSAVPTEGGNWWGEGDEKVFVDGAARPVFFGTGSEDYFNYSWSRPDLFMHPYCAQPICTGPGTSGYTTDLRFHVIDDVPFDSRFAFYMEAWQHARTRGLSYARVAYLYTSAGAIDDHRPPTPAELIVPTLPPREPIAAGGAMGATFVHLEDARATADGGALDPRAPEPQGSRLRIATWAPDAPGQVLRVPLSFPTDGEFEIRAVMMHRPDGGLVRAAFDGGAPRDPIELKTEHARFLRNVDLGVVTATAGDHVVEFRAERPGMVAIDFLWVRPRPKR